MMRVGVIGLGLIGGSMAKAYKRDPRWEVYGANRSKSIVDFALIAQAIDGELTDEILPTLDLLFLASYPQGVIDQLRRVAPMLSKNCVVIDLSGIKQKVCEACFPIAQEYGFTFVGGHPMAGTHNSGFKYSRADLYKGAPMVLVPPRFDDIDLFQRLKDAMAPCGFGMFSVTTAEEHDRMIAFTSQMPHVLSNAFIKSPTARQHKGFSAGSFADMTRVARLSEDMWTELFFDNREALLPEVEGLVTRLAEYRDALRDNDPERMRQLLREGREIKERLEEG